MVGPEFRIVALLAASWWVVGGFGRTALAKEPAKQARRALPALLTLESPGLSANQHSYLQREIAENGSRMRRAKRTGRLTYPVGPKGVRLDGRQAAFHDKRDSVMFFWSPQVTLDRKRECLVRKAQSSKTQRCLQESEGRTVAYDEVWEDMAPSGAWGRVYWKEGKFALAVAFEDDDLSMVFEQDWCVAASRCPVEP